MATAEFQISAHLEDWSNVDQLKFIVQLKKKLSAIVLNGDQVPKQGPVDPISKEWATRMKAKLAGSKSYYRTRFGKDHKFAALWYVEKGQIYVERVDHLDNFAS